MSLPTLRLGVLGVVTRARGMPKGSLKLGLGVLGVATGARGMPDGTQSRILSEGNVWAPRARLSLS